MNKRLNTSFTGTIFISVPVFKFSFMKRLFFCAALSFVSVFMIGTQTQAQLQRGNVLIGADLANIDLSLDKGGNFGFRISPKIAWFINNNLALGGYLHTGLSTAKGAGTSVSYGVGALGRYYVNDETINLIRHSRFFVEGTVGIEGDNPAVGDNTNGLGLGVGPGWTYFISPNIGLEALLKYNGIVGFGSAPTSNNLNLSFGFQIYLSRARTNEIRENIERNK
jgi:hypothetical protein